METIYAKTIVTKTKAPAQWFGIDYNMNIYKGCCHGCIYCDSRSDCYGIEAFDRVKVKENALQIIRDDLRRKTRRGVVGTGAMSDPYNPFEKELQVTRHALELCDAFEFGVAVATKSSLMVRDTDIYQSIAEHSPVLLKVTVTTADDDLAAKIEPAVARSSERFRMIERMSAAGLYTGILLMPVLPFLEDNEENIGEIIRRAEAAGARFIYPAFGMTLRGNQRDWYYKKLKSLFPDQDLVEKYRKRYGNHYECRSPRAKKLWEYFAVECQKRGIVYQMQDIISQYKKPYQLEQLRLFDEMM
ncbi:MAG: radical SAM protein [Hespellia sp.]|jgi:DNA repair photolyase|nr:radical SAM protein [Hespellia sp.]